MIFLIFLGTAVESIVGGMGLITVYIIGGIFGGSFYLLLNQNGMIPVVGASASLSALLSFYLFMEPRKRIRYIYFVSPSKDHYGLIYLPKFLIFPLFILSDITQVLSMSQYGIGSSVAHSAHIGGVVAGVLLAFLEEFLKLFNRSKTSTHSIFSNTHRL